MDTMRGSLGGTFQLGFTDSFGQTWYTEDIEVNPRLSSKAYVAASPSFEVVTFHPALPYGELEPGDFLMIGDERQEVVTVYPLSGDPAIARPLKLGGVVDSVVVRSDFQARSHNVPAFRAGPSKGIRAALMGLPGGIVPNVAVDTMNGGTLMGHVSGGAVTSDSVTTLSNIQGDYDTLTTSSTSGVQAAGPTTYGGLAPYDTVRVTNTAGISEYLQLTHIDHALDHASISSALATGSLSTSITSADAGLAAGKVGALYKAGGYVYRIAHTLYCL